MDRNFWRRILTSISAENFDCFFYRRFKTFWVLFRSNLVLPILSPYLISRSIHPFSTKFCVWPILSPRNKSWTFSANWLIFPKFIKKNFYGNFCEFLTKFLSIGQVMFHWRARIEHHFMWARKVFRRYLISQSGIYQNELISRILIKTQKWNDSEHFGIARDVIRKIAFISDLT